MSKYIKLEDAIKEAKAWSMYVEDDLVSRLERLPSIDIVRCEDCKYSEWFSDDPEDGGCNLVPLKVAIDDYCSRGERKESE